MWLNQKSLKPYLKVLLKLSNQLYYIMKEVNYGTSIVDREVSAKDRGRLYST